MQQQTTSTQRQGFECPECHKLYKHANNLKSHWNIHTSNAYVCQFCNKRFGRKSNWLEHLRVHTGETPFKCEICKKGFKQKNAWKKHLKIHCINNVPPRVRIRTFDLINHREQKDCYNTNTTRKPTRKKQSLNDCHLQTQHMSEKDQIVDNRIQTQHMSEKDQIAEKIVSSSATITALNKKPSMPLHTNNNLCERLNQRILHYQNSNQQTIRTITQPFTGNKCGNAFADDYNSIQNDSQDQNLNQTWTTNPFLDEIRSLSPINPYFSSDYSMFHDYNNMELTPVFTAIDTMSENLCI